MTKIGSVNTPVGRKALLLGSGELGKEVAIALMRMGVQVVACDKYPGAPAMQVAHRHHVFNMLDPEALRRVIEEEKPDHIIPEVEAIATTALVELEKEGYHVTPTATAALLTMNREGIRRLAAEDLGLPTSPYRFASTEEEFREAVKSVGIPCVVKPIIVRRDTARASYALNQTSRNPGAWRRKADAQAQDVSSWKASWISTTKSPSLQCGPYPELTSANL